MITAKTTHLLLVDDNSEIRESLGAYLRRNGNRVTTAGDSAQARAILEKAKIDLIILDIMMPGEDGLSLTRHLSALGGPPILLLSAKGEDIDKIIGLEVGADDYMTKPFNPRELLARVESILRRDQAPPRQSQGKLQGGVRFGQWSLKRGDLFITNDNGDRTYLSTTEMQLLEVFLDRPGMVLDRDALLDLSHVDGLLVNERTIDSQVSRLRKKLGDNSVAPLYIRTIWGGGYALVVKPEAL